MKPPLFFAAAVALALLPAARAEVRPNALFSDNAVLQAGRDVTVWGTAADGELVTVTVAGRTGAGMTKHGRWFVRLPPMPPGGPYTLMLCIVSPPMTSHRNWWVWPRAYLA